MKCPPNQEALVYLTLFILSYISFSVAETSKSFQHESMPCTANYGFIFIRLVTILLIPAIFVVLLWLHIGFPYSGLPM